MSSKKYPSRRFYQRAQQAAERELFELNTEDLGQELDSVSHNERIAESLPGPSQLAPITHLPLNPRQLDSSCMSNEEITVDLHNPEDTVPPDNFSSDEPTWSLNSFKSELADWAVKANIAHSHLSALLRIIKKHRDFNDLPSDARSLLKTPRTTNTVEICGGKFVYFGLSEAICQVLQNETTLPENIDLLIGIDGLPIAKSSTIQLWPQLGKIRSLPHTSVFVIGIFHGSEKPTNANDFLSLLVQDLKTCIENGITVNGEVISINHLAFVCDAPAKSFILQIKGHSGYYSCTRCRDEGKYLKRRVCFSTKTVLQRTHADFVNQTQEEYHLGVSILIDIPRFDVVRDFPLDYMHLVCLGVVKKIMNLWLKGHLSYRLSGTQVSKINSMMKSLRPFVPSDFVRKPRRLEELPRWKATELRFFLLYSGPVLLSRLNDIRPEIIENFMCLSSAMMLVLNPKKCRIYQNYIRSLLECFVINFQKIYGEHLISHNIHGLLHLADDVATFGALDSCSAFHFENYMQKLKTLIRKHHLPLEQISRRLKEQSYRSLENSNIPAKNDFKQPHESGPLIGCCTSPQFKSLTTFKLSTRDNDSFCLLPNTIIVKVKNFAYSPQTDSMVLIGEEYECVRDLFKTPFKSSRLNIFLIRKKEVQLKEWSVQNIEGKLMALPYKRNLWAAMPLIHM